mgnify:CR=1 FL=1
MTHSQLVSNIITNVRDLKEKQFHANVRGQNVTYGIERETFSQSLSNGTDGTKR